MRWVALPRLARVSLRATAMPFATSLVELVVHALFRGRCTVAAMRIVKARVFFFFRIIVAIAAIPAILFVGRVVFVVPMRV